MNMKRKSQVVFLQYYDAPCGQLVLASMGEALCLCDWNGMPCAERNKRRIARYVDAEFCTASSPVLEQTKLQLDDYFAGQRPSQPIPLPPFGTAFQLRVWKALLEIPYGETRSYLEIAQRIGNPRGVRAVAQAIGANRHPHPLPPGHRQQPLPHGLHRRTGQEIVFARTGACELPITTTPNDENRRSHRICNGAKERRHDNGPNSRRHQPPTTPSAKRRPARNRQTSLRHHLPLPRNVHQRSRADYAADMNGRGKARTLRICHYLRAVLG